MAAPQTYADALKALFRQYNLVSLVAVVDDILLQGMGESEGLMYLYNSDAYKERFAGNEGRAQKLTPGEYLALEQDYKSVFAGYMLPNDFYDDPEKDFAQLIANDLSPDEVAERAKTAWDFTTNGDQAVKDQLAEWYGLTSESDVVAYFMDPEKAQALVNKRGQMASMGAAARRNNFNIDRATAEKLASLGVDSNNVQQQIAGLGQVKPELDAAARRYGEDYTTDEQLTGLTTGLASAERKRKKLIEQESGAFEDRGKTNLSSNNTDRRGDTIDKRGDY